MLQLVTRTQRVENLAGVIPVAFRKMEEEAVHRFAFLKLAGLGEAAHVNEGRHEHVAFAASGVLDDFVPAAQVHGGGARPACGKHATCPAIP